MVFQTTQKAVGDLLVCGYGKSRAWRSRVEAPEDEATYSSWSRGRFRGQGRRRSVDLRFFRPALYRLSYLTNDLKP